MNNEDKFGRAILRVMYANISENLRPSGFSAVIAIGVRDDLGERWLNARCGSRATATLDDHASDDACTRLLMGEEEFESLVMSGCAPSSPRLMELSGDPRALARFLGRYLVQKNALSLRAGPETASPSRR